MSEFLSALRSGFGFLTTIPVGITMEGIERLMKHIYLFPVVGAVLGIIFGGIGYASVQLFSPAIVSVLVIIAIYYFTGFNHIDGLADFGDGVASHSSKEKKIAAMRDTALGTGGLIFCIIAITGLFSLILSILENQLFFIPYVLVVSEISSKQSMVTVAAFGKRLHEGFGAITVDNAKFTDFIAGMIFSGIVAYFLLGLHGLAAIIFAQFGSLLVLNTANRHFGGVSGDVVGASNEIGRLAALFYFGGTWML